MPFCVWRDTPSNTTRVVCFEPYNYVSTLLNSINLYFKKLALIQHFSFLSQIFELFSTIFWVCLIQEEICCFCDHCRISWTPVSACQSVFSSTDLVKPCGDECGQHSNWSSTFQCTSRVHFPSSKPAGKLSKLSSQKKRVRPVNERKKWQACLLVEFCSPFSGFCLCLFQYYLNAQNTLYVRSPLMCPSPVTKPISIVSPLKNTKCSPSIVVRQSCVSRLPFMAEHPQLKTLCSPIFLKKNVSVCSGRTSRSNKLRPNICSQVHILPFSQIENKDGIEILSSQKTPSVRRWSFALPYRHLDFWWKCVRILGVIQFEASLCAKCHDKKQNKRGWNPK